MGAPSQPSPREFRGSGKEQAAPNRAREGKAGLLSLTWAGGKGSSFSQPLHEAAGDGAKNGGTGDEGNRCPHQQGHEQGVPGWVRENGSAWGAAAPHALSP